MDGVTILNTITARPNSICGILIIICIAIFSTFLKKSVVNKEIIVSVVFGVSILLFVFIGYVFIYEILNPITQYEITISDTVNLKEFNEHYKIIDQRGEIYVVEGIEISTTA